MRWLLDTFVPNFTVTRSFVHEDKTIYEYVYSSKRYLTDTWPPKTNHFGFPIKKVIREDGKDVTENVLRFSGPKRNFVHNLGVCTIKKKIFTKFHNFGIRITIEDYIEKYNGTVYVSDIFGGLKIIHIE